MSSDSPDPSRPRPAGSPSMLDRLKGVMHSLQPETSGEDEVLPGWDNVPTDIPAAIPVALPIPTDPYGTTEIPLALPVDAGAGSLGKPVGLGIPVVPAAGTTEELPLLEAAPSTAPEIDVASAPVVCRICGTPRQGARDSCADCGYYFSPDDLAPATVEIQRSAPVLVRERYELGPKLSHNRDTSRYRALDHGAEGGAVPVVILCEPAAGPLPEAVPGSSAETPTETHVFPTFEIESDPGVTAILPMLPTCPSITWERTVLNAIDLPSLPRVVDNFIDGGMEYLVEEIPAGTSLWDAWDDPDATAELRFGWLIQIAATVHAMHLSGGMFEGLRPENFVIDASGQLRFRELTDILPLPLPPDYPIRGNLYGAPELVLGRADARADLFGFGALLYALHVGRELNEADFDRPGHPKPFIPRFPDIHPAFGRLMSKTFRHEVDARFPTDEAVREDPSGFQELIRTLKVLRRTFDNVRLEIAAWTTTGMVRTGNEDAFALLHGCESRQDDLGESALVLLADGMGGYEAGEVAAALTLQVARQHLVSQKPFSALAGASHFPTDALTTASRPEGHAPAALDVEGCKQALRAALREANRQVYAAARAPGTRRRGMGCTAEAVYINGRHVVVGHIGDSRTYHLHEGRLLQLTRDQTLVNRLVELGSLTEEEAEHHPRRNELQQAVGGQPDVEPGLYSSPLSAGDWIVVCSDGLSNHIGAGDLKQMLQSEAQSADMAARRLVNLANIEGATDNATVVVIRVT
jgi:PPM family protein phosphatase